MADVGLPLTLGSASASASAGGAIAVRGSTMWNSSSTMLVLGSDSVDRCAQALFMCEYLGALRLCRSCRRCLGQVFFLGQQMMPMGHGRGRALSGLCICG